MILADAISSYLRTCLGEKNLTQLTVDAYKIDLDQYLRFAQTIGAETDVNGSPELVQGFVEYLRGTLSLKNASIKRKLAVVRAFMKFLEQRNLTQMNSFRPSTFKWKKERILPRVLNFNQMNGIIDFAKKEAAIVKCAEQQRFAHVRDYAFVEVLFYSGARVGEVLKLNVADYDVHRGVANIQGKGRRERLIFLGCEPVVEALNAYLVLRRLRAVSSEPSLFINRDGKRLSAPSAARIVKNCAIGAGIETTVTPHVFRHTMATLLLENGADLRSIQDILGHASISTTEIYTHVSSARKRHVMSAYHPRRQFAQSV